MNEFLQLVIASLFSSSVAVSVITYIFQRRSEKISGEIKNQFEILMMTQQSGHAWKEKAVAELFGPLCFQLTRTQNAFKRYQDKNLYLEAKVLKEGNEQIRNLLLEKSYLIPPDLLNDADELVQHYDVWLEEFSNLRETENPANDNKFVFAGPKGFPFPRNAEKKFKDRYSELWNGLYQ